MASLIEIAKRLTFEAVRAGLIDQQSVFSRVKQRLAETVDTDPKRKCCIRASSMPPSLRAAVRDAYGAATRVESGIKKNATRRVRNQERRNVPFANGPKACPNAGCCGMATTPNSFATHASRCTYRPL